MNYPKFYNKKIWDNSCFLVEINLDLITFGDCQISNVINTISVLLLLHCSFRRILDLKYRKHLSAIK